MQQSDMRDRDSTQLSLEWFNTDINGYYRTDLKSGHLNVNSIYGKASEVIEVLYQCMFDILIISKHKIDGFIQNMLFVICNTVLSDRIEKLDAGGLLVY